MNINKGKQVMKFLGSYALSIMKIEIHPQVGKQEMKNLIQLNLNRSVGYIQVNALIKSKLNE